MKTLWTSYSTATDTGQEHEFIVYLEAKIGADTWTTDITVTAASHEEAKAKAVDEYRKRPHDMDWDVQQDEKLLVQLRDSVMEAVDSEINGGEEA